VKGDRRAAEKELRRLLRTLDDGSHVDPTRMTVRQWLVAWLAAVREEVSPKTHERYSEITENFLVPALGNLPVAKLAPSHIQQIYNEWATGGRRDGKAGGLSPRTRRHMHRILNSALARAVEQQVLARNPADAFKRRLPKVERREMTILSADQSARLLAAIKHTRTYWPVLLALSTGMRRGEVFALRWKNVDLERVMESLEADQSQYPLQGTQDR
jgi:integrase